MTDPKYISNPEDPRLTLIPLFLSEEDSVSIWDELDRLLDLDVKMTEIEDLRSFRDKTHEQITTRNSNFEIEYLNNAFTNLAMLVHEAEFNLLRHDPIQFIILKITHELINQLTIYSVSHYEALTKECFITNDVYTSNMSQILGIKENDLIAFLGKTLNNTDTGSAELTMIIIPLLSQRLSSILNRDIYYTEKIIRTTIMNFRRLLIIEKIKLNNDTFNVEELNI